MRAFAKLTIGIAVLAAAGPAGAARPLATEDAWTLGPERFEFEAAYEHATAGEHGMGAALKAGVAGRLDVGVAVPYRLRPDPAFCPADVSLKFGVAKGNGEGGGWPVAVAFTQCTGEGTWRTALAASRVAGRVTAHANAGWRSGPGGSGGSAVWAVALELAVLEGVVLVQEVVGAGGAVDALAGARWSTVADVAVDAGARIGLGSGNAARRTVLGLTLAF
jgi:hypothetical protein